MFYLSSSWDFLCGLSLEGFLLLTSHGDISHFFLPQHKSIFHHYFCSVSEENIWIISSWTLLWALKKWRCTFLPQMNNMLSTNWMCAKLIYGYLYCKAGNVNGNNIRMYYSIPVNVLLCWWNLQSLRYCKQSLIGWCNVEIPTSPVVLIETLSSQVCSNFEGK